MSAANKVCSALVELRNRDGLHARPAHLFVCWAAAFGRRDAPGGFVFALNAALHCLGAVCVRCG